MQRLKPAGVGGLRPVARAALLLALMGAATHAVGMLGQQSSISRQEKVEKLLRIIRDRDLQRDDPKQFLAAMQELGNLRAVEAIDDLVGLLTYERDWQRERRPAGYEATSGSSPIPYTGRHYLATLALADIGEPALPELIKVIENHDEASLETANANYTVRVILLRHGGRNAEAFFKDAAAKAQTPQAAERSSARWQY